VRSAIYRRGNQYKGDVLYPRLDNVKALFPRSRTMVIDDVDAFATLEKPEEFARAVLDFLKNPGI